MAEKTKGRLLFDPAGQKPVFAWESPEFLNMKRNGNWVLIIALAGILIALLLYFQANWTGMALVILATITFTVVSQTKPKQIQVALFGEGLVVDNKVYRYDDFKSFWINVSELPKARLQFSGRFAGQVMLPLSNIDPLQIRAYLGKHLPEEQDRGEDMIDWINRMMRF